MKKHLAILLAIITIITIAACGKNETQTPVQTTAPTPQKTPVANVKTFKIGVSIYQYKDAFMSNYRDEIENYFKMCETDTEKYNVTFKDAQNDAALQANQIQEFINQGMDVVILNPVEPSTAEQLVKQLDDATIPLVIINREPSADAITSYPTVCYVGADARQSGFYQSEIIYNQPNHGDINGDGVVSYIVIEGDTENRDSKYRTEYCVKTLTDEGIQVKCLYNEIGNWDRNEGQRICETALKKYGTKIDVVFSNNDMMAMGASDAIKKAGRTVGKDIYLVGVDMLEETIEMIKNGEMTGTVYNDYIGQSHTAVDLAIDLIHNRQIMDFYWVDYIKCDRATVDTYF